MQEDINNFRDNDDHTDIESSTEEKLDPNLNIITKMRIKVREQPKKSRRLYDNGNKRVCGKCHQIKPYSNFLKRRDGVNISYRSLCKQCYIEKTLVYALNNKYKIIMNLYNKNLKGKCTKCNSNISNLPTLEFHHPNPKLKSGQIKLSRNWEKTLKRLEKEQVIILCRNCHKRETSNLYNRYKEIIQKGEFDSHASNHQILQYVKHSLNQSNQYQINQQIVFHIKKRLVINQLYNGKCVGCGKITTENNLPSLHFHHRDGNNPHKGHTWRKIKQHTISSIKMILKQENCIALCSNCHILIDSHQYKKSYKEIVKSEYWNQIQNKYNIIENNIKNYKFKLEIN
ncbi:MAG: hypothetical protein ACFFA0_11720 [Promethearchaeota archaeon]